MEPEGSFFGPKVVFPSSSPSNSSHFCQRNHIKMSNRSRSRTIFGHFDTFLAILSLREDPWSQGGSFFDQKFFFHHLPLQIPHIFAKEIASKFPTVPVLGRFLAILILFLPFFPPGWPMEPGGHFFDQKLFFHHLPLQIPHIFAKEITSKCPTVPVLG